MNGEEQRRVGDADKARDRHCVSFLGTKPEAVMPAGSDNQPDYDQFLRRLFGYCNASQATSFASAAGRFAPTFSRVAIKRSTSDVFSAPIKV